MLLKLLRTPNDLTLTLARIILATIFFAHGSQKMFGLFGAVGMFFGLFSRVAAAGLLVVMIVAPFANHLYPNFFMNWTGRQMGEGYEYHLLAIALIVTILVRGAGAISLDRLISTRTKLPG